MFEKHYGKCNILGDENFDVLIEYRYALRKDKDWSARKLSDLGFDPHPYTEIIIGKDIVTGTPVFSMLPSKSKLYGVSTLEEAAELKVIKKGNLIVRRNKEISVSEMANYLNEMTEEAANEYIKKVNDLKEMYSKAMFRAKHGSSDCMANEELQKENLEVGKERIKRLVRKINK
jgi:hypothetical protein